MTAGPTGIRWGTCTDQAFPPTTEAAIGDCTSRPAAGAGQQAMVEGGPTTVRQLLEGGVVYHQRQSLQLCAVHTLNNLFCEPPALSPATPARRQRRVNTARPRARLAAGNDGEPGTAARVRGFNKEPLFDKPRLDAIAEGRQREFAPGAVFNPHKSALGLGNYDVVVIESGRSPPCCPAIRCPHTAVAFRSAALGWGWQRWRRWAVAGPGGTRGRVLLSCRGCWPGVAWAVGWSGWSSTYKPSRSLVRGGATTGTRFGAAAGSTSTWTPSYPLRRCRPRCPPPSLRFYNLLTIRVSLGGGQAFQPGSLQPHLQAVLHGGGHIFIVETAAAQAPAPEPEPEPGTMDPD